MPAAACLPSRFVVFCLLHPTASVRCVPLAAFGSFGSLYPACCVRQLQLDVYCLLRSAASVCCVLFAAFRLPRGNLLLPVRPSRVVLADKFSADSFVCGNRVFSFCNRSADYDIVGADFFCFFRCSDSDLISFVSVSKAYARGYG